ncbi:MAG TPA: hypothetical protein VNX68_18970 [Nitrosopumilaceae archaeon]|nr:hypothetical protein [Nitrosopumilaceae archaeon]
MNEFCCVAHEEENRQKWLAIVDRELQRLLKKNYKKNPNDLWEQAVRNVWERSIAPLGDK